MDTSMNVEKASPSAAMAPTTHAIIARPLIGTAFPRAFKAATSSRARALPRSPLGLGTPRGTRRVRDLQHVDVTDERTESH